MSFDSNEKIENLACKIHLSVEQLLKSTYSLSSSCFRNWELFLFLVLTYIENWKVLE